MNTNKNYPSIYVNTTPGEVLTKTYDNNKVAHLGNSPVNLGLHIDLQNFATGVHRVSFKLFFDNYYSQTKLNEFKSLNDWYFMSNRIDLIPADDTKNKNKDEKK